MTAASLAPAPVRVSCPNCRYVPHSAYQPCALGGARVWGWLAGAGVHFQPAVWGLWRQLIEEAHTMPTIETLARSRKLTRSTFFSAFYRAGLPSPKTLLVWTRLAVTHCTAEAVRAQEGHCHVDDLANLMGYSSPQAFGRHLRDQGLPNPSVWIRTDASQTMARFMSEQVYAHKLRWERFEAAPLTVFLPRRGAV